MAASEIPPWDFSACRDLGTSAVPGSMPRVALFRSTPFGPRVAPRTAASMSRQSSSTLRVLVPAGNSTPVTRAKSARVSARGVRPLDALAVVPFAALFLAVGAFGVVAVGDRLPRLQRL